MEPSVPVFSVSLLRGLIRRYPGIDVPELAGRLGVSVTLALWAVYEVGGETYDGNRVRLKEDERRRDQTRIRAADRARPG